jgi:hypothetical protein
MKKIIIRVLIGLFAIGVLGYGGIITFLLAKETDIVFEPNSGKPPLTAPPDSLHLRYERIKLCSEDGVNLTGWVISSSKDSSASPWLLFCHGNGSNISYPDYVSRYGLFSTFGLNVLTFDYRGYGESPGTPSEAGFYKDATAAYKYLTLSRHISPERIIIYGHSLGTGVAIDLAARVPAAALVTEAGFQSIPEVAQRTYPFIPAGLLVRNRFMSIDKIDRISIPKLFVHSSEDEIFPLWESKALYEKALQPKTFLEIKGKHSPAALVSKESFCKALSAFLAGTTAGTESPLYPSRWSPADRSRRPQKILSAH